MFLTSFFSNSIIYKNYFTELFKNCQRFLQGFLKYFLSSFRKVDKSMFPTFEIVKELCRKQGISLNTLEERIGFARNSLYSWKNSSPKPEKLKAVADYFNVSTDYLLGRTDNPRIATDKDISSIDTQELETLVLFRKETEGMSDNEKERFNKALSGLMQSARNLIKDDSLW